MIFLVAEWIYDCAYCTNLKLFQISSINFNNFLLSCASLTYSYFHTLLVFLLRQCIVPIWRCRLYQVSHHFLLLDSHLFVFPIRLVALFWLRLSHQCLLDSLLSYLCGFQSHFWMLHHISCSHNLLAISLLSEIALICIH